MELDYDGIRIGLDYFYIKNLIVYNHLFFCFFFFQIDDIAMAGVFSVLINLYFECFILWILLCLRMLDIFF